MFERLILSFLVGVSSVGFLGLLACAFFILYLMVSPAVAVASVVAVVVVSALTYVFGRM